MNHPKDVLVTCDAELREPVEAMRRQRVRRAAKNLLMRAAGRVGAGLSAVLSNRTGEALGILTYHRVSPRCAGVPRPLHNVTPERFRRQLAGLRARGFEFRSLRQVLEWRQRGEPIPARTAIVTFDDGFQTVYTEAWPVLREWRIPATVFLATAYLDHQGPFWFDAWGNTCQGAVPAESYLPLTTVQCREMADSGLVELGIHTHTHADFRGRPREFRRDLETSIKVFESRFGRRATMFAFPFGSPFEGYAGGALAAAVRESGLLCGLTTAAELVDPKSSPFEWGRFNVFSWDTATTLSGKLEGWYSWAPKLGRKFSWKVERRGSGRVSWARG